MTSTQLRELLHTNLVALFPGVLWQQARMTKPTVEPWGVVAHGGEAPLSVNDPHRSFIYYRVWIYKNGDEAELVQLAADIKRALNCELLAGPDGQCAEFTWINTGNPFYDEVLMSNGIDLTFRNVASSI